MPVKILRVTAAFDSYILSFVLPLSENSETGDFVLMRSMGSKVEPVPLHCLILDCGLVQGEVTMEGRGFTASQSSPTIAVNGDESAQHFPEVFTACAVTCHESGTGGARAG